MVATSLDRFYAFKELSLYIKWSRLFGRVQKQDWKKNGTI
jgi:hypothetical protein